MLFLHVLGRQYTPNEMLFEMLYPLLLLLLVYQNTRSLFKVALCSFFVEEIQTHNSNMYNIK